MRYSKLIWVIAFIFAVLPQLIQASEKDAQALVPHKKVNFTYANDELKNKIQLTNVKLSKKGSLQRARVNLRNKTTQRLVLEYRTQWLDEDGFEVDDKSIWQQLIFYSKDETTLRSMGKHPDAHSLKIIIRYPNDNISRNSK